MKAQQTLDLVNRLQSDSAFRAELRANPEQALTGMGLPVDDLVRAVLAKVDWSRGDAELIDQMVQGFGDWALEDRKHSLCGISWLEVQALPAKSPALEDWAERFARACGELAGAKSMLLLSALGYPGRYLALVEWMTHAGAEDLFRSPTLSGFFAKDPLEAVATWAGPPQAYTLQNEVVHRWPDGERPVVLAERWTLYDQPATSAAFEADQYGRMEVLKAYDQDFYTGLTSRFLGDPRCYTVLRFHASVLSATQSSAIPQVVRWDHEHPCITYSDRMPEKSLWRFLRRW